MTGKKKNKEKEDRRRKEVVHNRVLLCTVSRVIGPEYIYFNWTGRDIM
jgi:hypothetical protein